MRHMKTNLAVAMIMANLLVAPAAQAENQMGYDLFNAQQAARLPRGGGSLGLDVGRGQVITDSGMSFELLRVSAVRRGSAAAQSGLGVGDQVIAIDGHVFPSVAAFAGYVGSLPPGRPISVDYMPSGSGPGQAQRVAVTMGNAAGALPRQSTAPTPERQGLTTGEKLAIGAGAVALFGCYEMGCFSRRGATPARANNSPAIQQPR